jgi:threonine/homoserine/homoserine lactone efflux protein
LAVFPQFLRLEYGSLVTQSIILGAITSLTQFAVYGAVALLAAETATWLRDNKARQIYLGRFVGTMLIAAAIWTIWQGWRKN